MSAASVNHWIIVPAVLPALAAALMVLALRHDLVRQRIVSIGATLSLLAVATGLFVLAQDGTVRVYSLGAWPAPFGIVLVLDRLSALMLLATALLATASVTYAVGGWDRRGRLFHPLLQFQLLGVNGAFLTGDVFNLFVFFEVMLIASYGLLLHGGGPERLKAGFQYVTINLVGSTLFLIAVGVIYAVTGTLNMADLAAKAGTASETDLALLKTGLTLLLAVFAIKASLVPLHWWLPATYAAAAAPVAALFIILTKVGAYALLRIGGLTLGPDAGALAGAVMPWIVPLAAATLALGALGMLAAQRLPALAALATVGSMGTLLLGLGHLDAVSVGAALYYLLHSTLAGAALFLVVDLVALRQDKAPAGFPALQARAPVLAAAFLIIAVAVAGLPPLSGFLGKLMILEAVRTSPGWPVIWAVVLMSSLVMLLALARAGVAVFWGAPGTDGPYPAQEAPESGTPESGAPGTAVPMQTIALGCVLLALAGLTIAAGPVTNLLDATARQSLDRASYIRAVIGEPRMLAEGSAR